MTNKIAESCGEVFAYRDFRQFLLAHAAVQKNSRPQWSFGVWARQLGLAGTASLTMVLHAQRLPGPKLTERLVRYFRFDKRAAAHFRGLVALERARKDPEAYVAIAEKLSEARPAGDVVYLDDAAFCILSSWYYFAIREMTRLSDFREDPLWISQRLGGRAAPHECRQALRGLLAAGLLEREETGQLKPKAASVQAGTGLKSLAVRRYHSAALENASRAIDGECLERRTFAASTLTVKAGAVASVQVLIERFQDDVARVVEAHDGEGDDVYQMSVQFVPLTAPRSTFQGRSS